MLTAPLERPETTSPLRIVTARAFAPLLDPIRYKGAKGGRGSGKSHFYAENLVDECVRTPGTRAVCLREIQKSISQSSKRTVEDKIIAMGVQSQFGIFDSYIATPGDGMIIFQGMQNHTAESIKSLEGYRIGWFDEAQRMSEFSLSILYPTFRLENSELWFSWNPRTPKDPVEKFFNDNKDDLDFICIDVDYSDNPWFPDVQRRDMERDRRRDPERYKHVWLGHYQTRSEARVFHNWKITEFDSPETAEDWEALGIRPRFYFGCDWGFSKDPTVLVRMFIVGRKIYIDFEAWKVGCEIDHCPAMFTAVPESTRWPIVADSANPQSISYMRRHGFPKMYSSVKGTGSVEEGVEFLKSYDIIVHPRCTHVADELATYSYDVDLHTEEVLPTLADKKNHTIDSARYALEPLRRSGMPARMGRY